MSSTKAPSTTNFPSGSLSSTDNVTSPRGSPTPRRLVSASSAALKAAVMEGMYTPQTAKIGRNLDALREMTINKLQFNKLGQLYGRDESIQQLSAVVTRSVEAQTRDLVLIQGVAGAGKSALALEMKAVVRKHRGRFALGKFDSQVRDEPYLGIAEACRAICRGLFDGDDDQSVELRANLQKELDSDAHLLASLIPNLPLLLSDDGTTVPPPQGRNSEGFAEAKARFQNALRRFIRVISSFQPLVMVLDDLQWADNASLDLLESLLSDTENKSSLIVVAPYRSDEVSADHPLHDTIQRIESSDQPVALHKVCVDDLEVADLAQMIADLLNESTDNTTELAECVHHKTNGNIFFSIQFLKSLTETKLLAYQFGLNKWTWETADVLRLSSSTDNVVELLQQKLHALPANISQITPGIACLGAHFKAAVVEIIMDRWKEVFVSVGKAEDGKETDSCSASELLKILSDLGLIVAINDVEFKWAHDKVQEAALALLEPTELREVEYIVGDVLLERLSAAELEEMIFIVADLVDQHPNPAVLPVEKQRRIRTLNADAGRKASEASAFRSSSIYYRRSIDMMDKNCWKTDYELALQLHSACAEACFASGDYDAMQTNCDEVLSNASRAFVDKRRVYCCLLYSILALDNVQDAQDLCVEILAKLGCRFPTRARLFHVLAGAMHINISVEKSIRKISSLKKIEDEEKEWIMFLLDHLLTCAYQNDDALFMSLVMIESFHSTLKYGLCHKTPAHLNVIGLFLVSLGNLKGAKVYGDKAVELLEEYGNCAARSLFIAYEFVVHWQYPIELCKKPLFQAYHAGVKSGDLESAGWSAYSYVEIILYNGGNLGSLCEDCSVYAARIKDMKQLKIISHVKLIWQLALCLVKEESGNDLFFSGGIVTLNELRRWIDDNNDEHLQHQLDRHRMEAKFFLGDYEGLDRLIKETGTDKGEYEKYHPGAYFHCPFYFHCALGSFELFRTTKRRAKKKMGLWFARKIKTLAKKGVSLKQQRCRSLLLD